MISFELAKELAAAGWPQEPQTISQFYYLENGEFVTWTEIKQNEFLDGFAYSPPVIYIVPPLEALIAACGSEFLNLQYNVATHEDWLAEGNPDDTDEVLQGEADDPAEAVARLFIALKGAK